MGINLQKGQRVEIGLTKVGVGLGWDPNQGASSEDYDLDASAFMLDSRGKIPADDFFVFYNNPESPDHSVASSGDDRSGGNSDGGDDETLTVNIPKIDPRIEQIVFVVTIHEAGSRKQNFGQVRNSYIRVFDEMTQEEICKYELGEDFSIETAIEFGRLYKRNGEWKFEAMGIGYAKELDFFVNKFA